MLLLLLHRVLARRVRECQGQATGAVLVVHRDLPQLQGGSDPQNKPKFGLC